MIVNLQIGTTIGHINCSAPTCCDDLAALARRALFLQMIMNIVEFYKNGEREIRYPDTKSSNLPFHLSMESKKNSTDTCVFLDGEQIPSVFQTVHLGIDRNTRSLVDIKKKLQLGRRTLYSLSWSLWEFGS